MCSMKISIAYWAPWYKLAHLKYDTIVLLLLEYTMTATILQNYRCYKYYIRKKILGYLALPSPYSGPSHLGHYPSI